MKTQTLQATIHQIEAPGLDRVRVILQDCGTGKGRIIIECFGKAWGTYFGAMPDDLRTFLAMADVEYLVSKLARPKETKQEHAYLSRIVKAIKEVIPELLPES